MTRGEIIKSWLDGETIQFKTATQGLWQDHTPYIEGDKILFFGATELRLKPKMAVRAVNVYVHKDQSGVTPVSNTAVFETVAAAEKGIITENNSLLYLHTIVVYYDGGRMIQTNVINFNQPLQGDPEW